MNSRSIFLTLALTITLPGFGMNRSNEIDQHAQEVFYTKRKITQENFDRAMNLIRQKINVEYLFDKLCAKLSVFVNQELTADEWSTHVQKSYEAILATQQKSVASALRMSCPLEEILVYTMYAIPN